MPDAKHLREVATRMFAIALQTERPEVAKYLAHRASNYLDQADELEKVTSVAKETHPDDPENV
jgi:hypothetical protein